MQRVYAVVIAVVGTDVMLVVLMWMRCILEEELL